MAASLPYLQSLTLPSRDNRCLPLRSKNWKNAFVHCTVSWKCKSVYLVPIRISNRFQGMRCFFTNGSSDSPDSTKEGPFSLGVSAPENLLRSKTLISFSMDGMNDFETQLQEFFTAVKDLIEKGDKGSAIDLLQANYIAVADQIRAGDRGIEQAAILDIVATGYMSLDDLKLAGRLLEMLNDIVGGIHNDTPLLGSVLLHMGSMYASLGKFEDAMLLYGRGIEILERLFGKHNQCLVASLLGLAKVFTRTGMASRAIDIYHRTIKILEKSRGAENEDIIIPLFGLGNVLISEGRTEDAKTSFCRILSIYQNLYGSKDGRVGMAMCSLAHALCAKGDIEEAIHLYRKGLQIITDSEYKALDDGLLEKMKVDLAELLHVAGRDHEGREILEECLLIMEKHKGSEHPSLVSHFLNLATSYSRSKNFVESERLLRTSLRIMVKTVGPEDQSITVPMLHLAVTLYHLKRDEEAEELALEVVRIRENAFGKHSLPVGEALDCLVSIQTRLDRDAGKVLALLKRVLSIQEKELGYESEEAMTTLKKVIFYLDKTGKKEEKLPLQKRLSVLRTKYKQKVAV
ncbi:hypothetical protein QJS10_CPB12g00815 [Acorus calamus]|uniref:Nephrocystin-3 n=1 Tax=Acorus calamus TaxID=4465 RepID=A0AAV9DKM5_ACOCL|nr:hypothetical protein QJS10_CPB12g00815 [Acorus calamus]